MLSSSAEAAAEAGFIKKFFLLGGDRVTNISDMIERYLKELLEGNPDKLVEVQRSELATRFNCVPSQINYVLTTRFSTGHGYVVESRRGGGGYIRILKIPMHRRGDLIANISNIIGEEIPCSHAEGIIRRLREEGFISEREARVMKAAMGRDVLRPGSPWQDRLRAEILKSMVATVLRD